MGISLSQTNASSLIRLDGAIDISEAAELKTVLLKALEAGNAIEISAETVCGLDVTAFQLLWAAGREAKRSGVQLALNAQIPDRVRSTLAEMGLDRQALSGEWHGVAVCSSTEISQPVVLETGSRK